MGELLKEMGQRMLDRRKQLKLTQEALAKMAHVTPQTVSTAELGTKAMRPETMLKICDALDISTDYLLRGQVMEGRHTPAQSKGLVVDSLPIPTPGKYYRQLHRGYTGRKRGMSASGNAALIPLFISSPLAKSLHCAGDQAEDRIICLHCLSQLRHIFRLRRPLLRRRGRCCFCSRAGDGGASRLFRVPRLLEQNLTHDGFNGGPVYGRSCRPYRLRIICKVSIVENDCIGDILCFPVVRLLFQQFDSCQMDRVTDIEPQGKPPSFFLNSHSRHLPTASRRYRYS